MTKYRLYPTLLDAFTRFQLGVATEENLLNRINRVRDFDEIQLEKMNRGTRFEKAVLNNEDHNFDPKIVDEFRKLLPKSYSTQTELKFNHEDIQFYGYADVVGFPRIIDIKTTSNYRPEIYLNSFQNLYLYALKDQGFQSMEYIIYDFTQIHHLILKVEDIDFQNLLDKMVEFTNFLEDNREFITDKKIFVDPIQGSLF